jgi:hypothetical protein
MFAAVMMFQFDVTTWGWIQLILGIVVALAGVGLLAGRTWARVVGITLAVLSAIANFLFIPHHPFWALLVIALDIFVIWALAATAGNSATPAPERRPDSRRRAPLRAMTVYSAAIQTGWRDDWQFLPNLST